uniref:uncharacterized protein LOC120812815 n=1 Tax=Gasterosteus aculeatus aculeatus TaxID=481459 RepID=UPI001A98E256|nr:uncharacterized protein LOC120812815 [Gasterosteus aculeatus aculeatus]XP_040024964.1 uncharacterized protein LOC120812817 [Gasterosteus aculeatus aculeatus]
MVINSAKLGPVAAGLPQYLRAVAAALTASRDIVGYAPLTLLVVSLILLEQKSSHLSVACYLRYHTCLLDMPNVTIKRCTNLNPASLLPIPGDGEAHNCLAELQAQCTPRPDLVDTPLTNSDMVMYVDGSASRDPQPGENRVGFAVVSESGVLCSGPLPCHLSAQAAELIALTEACKLATGKTVTVHTDSSPPTRPFEHIMMDFVELSRKVAAALPKPAEGPLHKLKPGDFVVVKDFRRKNWKARRWQGPFQILLVTQTAVK